MNSKNTAVLHTFNLQQQPYTLFFPGQVSDTAVNKCQDRPMICSICHNYGHTATRCRQKAVRRNFGEDDHTSVKTSNYPKESKSANCGEGHVAGSNNCKVKLKEMTIKKMQGDSRVGTQRNP